MVAYISNKFFNSYLDVRGTRHVIFSAWQIAKFATEEHLATIRQFIRIATIMSSIEVTVDVSTPEDSPILRVPISWFAYAMKADETSRMLQRIKFVEYAHRIVNAYIIPSYEDVKNIRQCDVFYTMVLKDSVARHPGLFHMVSGNSGNSTTSLKIIIPSCFEIPRISRYHIADWQRRLGEKFDVQCSTNDLEKKILRRRK
jgi:hypothetical protein